MAIPKPNRPLPIRLLNSLGKLGFNIPPIDVETQLKAARKATRLDDFGGDGFLEPLTILVDALERESRLTTLGRISVRQTIGRYLRNRLQIQDHLKMHPELLDEEIRRPLIILGLPRTGTTVMFNLLALDPANRAPLGWEASMPYPLPLEATHKTDPRIAEMQKNFDRLYSIVPRLKTVHEFHSELPQECVTMTSHEFLGIEFPLSYDVPSFTKWVNQHSWLPALRYHKLFLQYLQSGFKRERWVLKTPGHLPVIDDLLEVYPDACIIHMHRDPMRVMPSASSLSYELRCIAIDDIDPKEVGVDQTDLWEAYLNKAIDIRQKLGKDNKQFFDTQFEDVVRDPIALIQRIYQHFDIPFTEETKKKMDQYMRDKPREEHGKHHYTPEDFGLSAEKDGPRFKRYCDYFNIQSGTEL